jgi:hypothetical protein
VSILGSKNSLLTSIPNFIADSLDLIATFGEERFHIIF